MEAIGFDSPEVQAQIVAAFEAMRPAILQLAEVFRKALDALREAIQPLIHAVARWYREACRLGLIPRQYRNTMARRKLRRHVVLMTQRRFHAGCCCHLFTFRHHLVIL